MSLVLAFEPDAAQAEPLTAVVRAKLGAQLQMVASSHAAVVALNQRVPDVLLMGRDVPQDQRTKIVTHMRSLIADGGQIRTLDIPQFNGTTSADAFAKKVGACLAAAEEARVRAMASMIGRPAESEWDDVPLEEEAPAVEPAAPAETNDEAAADAADADVRLAEVALIEAEVEFRLKTELERLQAEAAKQQAAEIARIEAEAAERRAQEMARIEERAAAEASAREAMAAELERVRREAEQQVAAEVERIRNEAEQLLATKLDVAQAQAERDREERIARARAEADAARNAAIEEARQIVEEAAARARMAEEEVERVRLEAEAQLKDAVARARQESEAQLQDEVARARSETEARLEAQLASLMGENEQARHAQRQASEDADRIRLEVAQASEDADKIRLEAAQAARAAAEAALAAETARIRAEADERLESEIARLRAQSAVVQVQAIPETRLLESASQPHEPSMLAQVSHFSLHAIRWDLVATAALILLVVVSGVLYLPRAVRTVARTSSTLVGTAGNAAKAAAKRTALTVAERAIPRTQAAAAAAEPEEAAADTDPVAEAAAETGPGFLKAFSRIPMDIYADGTRIGSTEDGRQMLLPSGTHRIEFVSERFRYRSSTTVRIRPGHILPYTVSLPSGRVHVATTPGAEVFVDGERVGIAPLDAVEVPLGTREITVKTAAGEKHQVIEVKYGEAIELPLVPEAADEDTAPAPHLAPLVRSY